MTPNFPSLIKMLTGVKMPSFPRDVCSPGELLQSCWGPVQWELFESRHVIKFPNVISPDILMETLSFLLISMWFGLKAPGLGAPRCPSGTNRHSNRQLVATQPPGAARGAGRSPAPGAVLGPRETASMGLGRFGAGGCGKAFVRPAHLLCCCVLTFPPGGQWGEK